MHLHPYVVDELAEQHHRQLVALARAERLARRTARRANPRLPGRRMQRRALLSSPLCTTAR